MPNLRAAIYNVKKTHTIPNEHFKEVSPLNHEAIFKKINSTFLTTRQYNDSHYWWRNYKNLDHYGIHFKDRFAFEQLEKIVPITKALFWFVASEQNGKYWLYESDLESIKLILSEMYGFEYYLIDKKYQWILCENHHDILIGMGAIITRKLWLFETQIKPVGIVKGIFKIKEKLILNIQFNYDKTYLIPGSKIKLISTKGEIIETKIYGMDFQNQDIAIKAGLHKGLIPIGTEVWFVE